MPDPPCRYSRARALWPTHPARQSRPRSDSSNGSRSLSQWRQIATKDRLRSILQHAAQHSTGMDHERDQTAILTKRHESTDQKRFLTPIRIEQHNTRSHARTSSHGQAKQEHQAVLSRRQRVCSCRPHSVRTARQSAAPVLRRTEAAKTAGDTTSC